MPYCGREEIGVTSSCFLNIGHREKMKKTFVLTNPKIKIERMLEAARRDIKKYIKREQNKTLPENVDYWDFDCKYGKTKEEAKTIHIAEIKECLNEVMELKLESFYLEILAKPGIRTKKPEAK